jgi:5'-phosphate synthase pdxT subunit
VERHRPHVIAAGAEFMAVKIPDDFAKVDAFILPGGESTTMLKLINNFDLKDVLKEQFSKKPVWGICAGAILMADKVTNPAQDSFHILPMTVERNGYGRQLDSLTTQIEDFDVSFIRAPVIRTVNDNNVEVLAEYGGTPVWIRSGKYMVTTFHPELTLQFPSPMHKAFFEILCESFALTGPDEPNH